MGFLNHEKYDGLKTFLKGAGIISAVGLGLIATGVWSGLSQYWVAAIAIVCLTALVLGFRANSR